MLGMSQIPLLFLFYFLFFFKLPSLMEMKSLSEVTSGHGNRLEALLDFCLMSMPGVLQHSLLYTYFLCLEILGTKIKQGVPLSFPWSLKLY